MKTAKHRSSRMLIIALAAVLTAVAAYPQTAAAETSSGSSVNAYRYDMKVRLDVSQKRLYETLKIHVANKGSKALKRICIRNMAVSVLKQSAKNNSNRRINRKKSSRIISVTDSRTGRSIPLRYRKDRSVIYGDLKSHPLDAGQKMVLKIRCRTDIPKQDDRFGYNVSKAGKMFELSFCFPYIAMYQNGKWDESPYFDSGENRYRSCADYNVRFKAPEKYRVTATGTERKKGSYTYIKAPKVRDFALVACNYMKKETLHADGIRINNYYLTINRNSHYRRIARGAAADSVRLFTEKIGRYPYREIDVVQTRMGTSNGMEYPGLVMIAGDEYSKGFNPILEDTTDLCSLVSHEVAHEWFCVSAGNDEYREAWLDEGFATYAADVMYMGSGSPSVRLAERLAGEKPADPDKFNSRIDSSVREMIGSRRHFYINRPVNRYSFADYAEHVYSGGMAFLWELKKAMSDADFYAAVRDYYSRYTLKEAKTADFLRIIRSYNNDAGVNSIINKYIDPYYLTKGI